MRRARWLVLAAALAFALAPAAAAAHPHLLGATPQSGTSATAPPDRIVLSFAQALDPARSSASLVGPDGHATAWPSTVSGGTLAVQPPALPAGAWLLRWAVTGADGDRETGDYRFTVAPRPAAALPGTGGAASQPGTVERTGRLLLLVLGVPLAGLLLLGGAVLPADPRRRVLAGRRLATLRSALWAVELLSLCGFLAGLAAAGGSGLLLVSPAGPPLLVAAGVTAALGVAVFDGGALRAGEAASRATTLLGMGLGPIMLGGLVALAEAPGDLAGLVAGTLGLTALAVAAGAGIAAAARGESVTRLLRREIPEPRVPALRLSGVPAPRFQHAFGGAQPPPAPAGQPHPLPAGTPVHRRLSGHFVDLPRLLETLEWSAFTGYVRIEGGGVAGVLVLVAGELSAACLQGDDPATGPEAVRLLTREVSRGEALLDVVELEDETARAVVDLLSAPPLFSGLRARMVNLDGVLEDLGERRGDAAVVVSSPADTGVILVRGGGVHGAYTRTRPRLDDAPGVVTALAGDGAALVEVRIAPRRAAEARLEGEAASESPARRRQGPLWDRYDEVRQAAGLD
jgi:methionine-rich copper-binding protein CopC